MTKHHPDSITELLGIEDYHVRQMREEGNGFVVEVKRMGGEASCPCCGSGRLYRHGKGKVRRVLHSWSRGKRIYLLLTRQRWRCCGCGQSFTEGVPLLRPYSRLTEEAEEEALWEPREHSFSQVRKRLGVGYGTLRRLLERRVNQEALKWLSRGR